MKWYLLRPQVYRGKKEHTGWIFPAVAGTCRCDHRVRLDGLIEPAIRPWIGRCTEQTTPLSELTGLDDAALKGTLLGRAAIFCCGTATFSWSSYDIWPSLPEFAAKANPSIGEKRWGFSEPNLPDRINPSQPVRPQGPGLRMQVEYAAGHDHRRVTSQGGRPSSFGIVGQRESCGQRLQTEYGEGALRCGTKRWYYIVSFDGGAFPSTPRMGSPLDLFQRYRRGRCHRNRLNRLPRTAAWGRAPATGDPARDALADEPCR